MPNASANLSCQVLIIGSGLPGSIMALVLARLGYDVVVVDKTSHPRFAIGESSTPIADAYVARIARDYRLPELLPLASYSRTRREYPSLTVGRKRGFSYFWHDHDSEFSSGLHHQNEMVVAASANDELADSHWCRSEVDAAIVSWFNDSNVRLFESTKIESITDQAGRWRSQLDRGGKSLTLYSDFFIDASGAAGVGIQSQGGRSTLSELWTNTSAVFAHFEGLQRWSDLLREQQQLDHPFRCDDAAVHQLFSSGWMWQLRFHNGLTSCGIVQPNGNLSSPLDGIRDQEHALEYFRSVISQLPSLALQFSDSRTVEPYQGAFFRKRLQHFFDRGAGANWCALPNSIGFIDPLHSKGLAHALSGVYRIAKRFESVGPSNVQELNGQLYSLSQTFRQEIQFIDRLISACYFSLDNFELFRLATFWYFAAATCFEHAFSEDMDLDRPFLLSDDEAFSRRLFEYSARLKIRHAQPLSVSESTEMTERGLKPYDRVNLFHPTIHNMYGKTAAPENVKNP